MVPDMETCLQIVYRYRNMVLNVETFLGGFYDVEL